MKIGFTKPQQLNFGKVDVDDVFFGEYVKFKGRGSVATYYINANGIEVSRTGWIDFKLAVRAAIEKKMRGAA